MAPVPALPDHVVAVAPGRVNLIGDHTDYCDGLVLPIAIDRACTVNVRPRDDERWEARSDEPPEPTWTRFVDGVVAELRHVGVDVPGADIAVSSTVPPGAGLSSSSALAVALTLALAGAAGVELDRVAAARLALDAEVRATGVPGGLMDQLASLYGRADHALLIDCRSLAVDPIPLPRALGVVVVHSGVTRTLAGTEYAERRAACEDAAARLGLAALRDASPDDVADDPRARHVVSENARVDRAAEALRAGDVDTLGRLLLESHASLRDDYEVSTPELDLLVDLLMEHGAIGARLTGAGFGGCVVAIVQRNHADDLLAKVVPRYRSETGLEPSGFAVRASDGAAVTR